MKEITFDELKQIEKDILKAFHGYCQIHGLTYFLYAGTLLGAVRHQGFIPWDDDIDIAMPRADYEKLYELSQGDAPLPFPLVLASVRNTEHYNAPFFKLMDSRTHGHIDYLRDEIDLGVWVDIFPIDGIPGDRETYMPHLQSLYHAQKELEKICCPFRWTYHPLKLGKRILQYIVYHGRNYREEASRIDKAAQKYAYTESDLVASAAFDGPKRIFKRSYFEEKILIPFEGAEFYAPKQYDALLRDMYGDYMQLPPENQRVSIHPYTAWWNEDNIG